MNRVIISKISNLNAVVIKQAPGNRFFISTNDSIIISIPNFATIVKYLVLNGLISKKVLEGILSELED